MWHVSVSRRGKTDAQALRICREELRGVGVADDVSLERTDLCVHVRRHLTSEEMQLIGGGALDIRETDEAWGRFLAIHSELPVRALRMAAEESVLVRAMANERGIFRL